MISGPVVAPRSGGKPKQLVVLLHGYGADGEDLIGLAQPLGDVLPDALFVSPNAPTRCAQNPFGFEWFPIGLDRGYTWADGAPMARPGIVEFIEAQWAYTGLTAADTFVVGFSQGAMMALHVGLAMTSPLRGIVAFAGALIPPEGFEVAPKAPVCLIHGDVDQVVDVAQTRDAARILGDRGYDVSLHISPGVGHGISQDGLEFAAAFMADRLGVPTD